jgi:hypothetical protein
MRIEEPVFGNDDNIFTPNDCYDWGLMALK